MMYPGRKAARHLTEFSHITQALSLIRFFIFVTLYLQVAKYLHREEIYHGIPIT
ncbi:hypothetical protein QY97_00459 [Bacillus thermotolerans]|uniref:Uncharacterized protein n=2 Tax=Bacillus thermotolerans TaxID=1221996 RepID=A0A0F5HV85_BACTR|nr:hypothetical protein QY97_00459 [Bacillus thermotolerans]KKB41915.1 hypothetical protein QY96_01817 [Bacillus thermotolerans]KKB43074.1 hypothetical protein QY95_02674 [Bacillus thermotolerans]